MNVLELTFQMFVFEMGTWKDSLDVQMVKQGCAVPASPAIGTSRRSDQSKVRSTMRFS